MTNEHSDARWRQTTAWRVEEVASPSRWQSSGAGAVVGVSNYRHAVEVGAPVGLRAHRRRLRARRLPTFARCHYLSETAGGLHRKARCNGLGGRSRLENVGELVALLDADPDPGSVSHLHEHAAGLYTPLYYATSLLRALRQFKPSYRVALRARPGRKWLDPMVDEAKPLVRTMFGNEPNGRITPGHRARMQPLQQWLEASESDEYPAIVLTRVVARAIEDEYSDTFWEQMRSYYNVLENGPGDVRTRALRSGDPVPVCNTIYAGRASLPNGNDDPGRRGVYGTNPRNLPRWREPDRLSRVLLAPNGIESFQVSLDFSLDGDLELLPTGKVATVHPTVDLEAEYCWSSDGRHLFDVRPRTNEDDPQGPTVDEYRDLLKRSLDVSHEQEATLVVLPELSVTADLAEWLADYWKELIATAEAEGRSAPVVLVAGSYHHLRPPHGKRANTATIVSKAAVCEVDKAVPYVQVDKDAIDGDLVEEITLQQRPVVTLFCSERMTMATFICVDYLLDPLRDLVRDLDVTLTLLPSMSTKSKVFAGLIAGHVAATQGAVVLANAVEAHDDGSRGLIGHPAFSKQIRRLNKKFGVEPGPGVAIIDLRSTSASRWVPVTAAS